jgi:hypothetical protein
MHDVWRRQDFSKRDSATTPLGLFTVVSDYDVIFAGLLALQFITYGNFFTTLIFTNHTFPDSWVSPIPTYKTYGEGRWFADIIFWLQGASGVQPFQVSVAVALQSLNGLLFARFLGLEKRLEVFLAAAFLCHQPAILDYYCFAMDHISYTPPLRSRDWITAGGGPWRTIVPSPPSAKGLVTNPYRTEPRLLAMM